MKRQFSHNKNISHDYQAREIGVRSLKNESINPSQKS